MGQKRTEEFRKDAVRIASTSGLTCKQVADDLGAGMSTLNKWITGYRDTDVVSKEGLGLAQENDRLRREIRLLKEEREILKKSHPVLREPNQKWAGDCVVFCREVITRNEATNSVLTIIRRSCVSMG